MPDTTEKSEKTELTKTSAVCAVVTSFDDEILAEALITRGGAVVHADLKPAP